MEHIKYGPGIPFEPYWTKEGHLNEEGDWNIGKLYMEEKEKEDAVSNPKHYQVIGEYEAIDIIKKLLGPSDFIAYCYGNILKYTLRAKKKENFVQDLAKATMYQSFIDGM